MAGHSKFKNIQHRKGAQDKKRAKMFTKLVREIITAAKLGGGDVQNNPRLRNVIIAARTHNLPKERIERAINQASSDTEADNYVEIRYEGFAQSGIAIIVEALTDNKNRTAADVRAAFTKLGGNLAETGSVSFMFDHLGMIQYDAAIATNDVILNDAIEMAANDVVSDDSYHYIYTEIDKFSDCLDFFTQKYGEPIESYIGWKPHDTIIVDDHAAAEKLLKLVDILEESDDVQRVFGNYQISDEVLATF
ncbi:YebC/PmpR family DNA-binding transcriptional regulator [Candidatus Trichorickettsia mobilis]|uniref:YebC/PmpR family DNA-binding transcriptional regulator n=1 Tax=Candidatus Trichorickettsia mobilis TaxID=1346319 RepID=UPI00292EB03E|nr:YebC/PmpR family DNA-binding transcriptional regulator [Candidatus Trichorickettsia mobilis]